MSDGCGLKLLMRLTTTRATILFHINSFFKTTISRIYCFKLVIQRSQIISDIYAIVVMFKLVERNVYKITVILLK